MFTGARFAPALARAPRVEPSLSVESRQERDTAGIVEEQELLKRQLQRLRRTMEGLIPRLEKEGRPRALELLRDGLKLLEAREEATRRQTIDELMDTAREGVQAGQAVQSLESQEAVIRALERLVAILLDRPSMENLDQSLEQLRAMRKELEALKNREQKLERDTEQLREDSKSEEHKALEEQLRQLAAKQRELLERNEALARERGTGALEQIERELEELLERQKIDRQVLEAWQPEASAALAKAMAPLDEARRAASRAERLREAAGALKEAASAAREAQSAEPVQSAAQSLDQAAEREERHQRAANDPSAERAAQALRESAGEMRQAADDAAARQRAAASAQTRAEELERAAAELDQAAQSAREQALQTLDRERASAPQAGQPPSEGESAPHERGAEAREALQRALQASPQTSPQDSPQASSQDAESAREAARATERAAEALRNEVEQEQRLGPALSASQAQAAQTSERLQRGVESLPPAGAADQPIDEQRAQQALARAAEAMKAASTAARASQPRSAAEQAKEAEQALQEALAALENAREQRSEQGSSEQAAKAQAVAAEQSQLAQSAAQSQSQASASPPEESGQHAAEPHIERAREAMERAASEMQQGRSSSAAGSQREALDALEQALREADDNARPKDQADQQRADQLAAEQKQIQRELLDLAVRNEQRKNAKPSQNLPNAAKKAGEATESLDEGELDDAQEQEQEVQREMDEALSDLGEEEEQYQRLRQEELLFRITEEVTALIEGQRAALAQVREVDAGREPGAAPSRADRLRLRRVARDEAQLAARANEISSSIEAEQSFVFAHVLREVQQDLERISRDIDETGDYQTGERVQALMEDALDECGWVLEALKKEQRDREQQQQQQQQQDQSQNQQSKNRLVPDVAELKLLRKLEVETLDELNRLLLVYPELQSADGAPEALEDVLRLAERHERTSKLFQKFRARLGVPAPEGEIESQ